MKRTEIRRTTALRPRRPGRRRANVHRDARWLSAVRDIECCVRCQQFGVEAAHRDVGKGMGQKTDDATTAALCSACHHELGNGADLDRETRRHEMDWAIVETIIELARAGRLAVR